MLPGSGQAGARRLAMGSVGFGQEFFDPAIGTRMMVRDWPLRSGLSWPGGTGTFPRLGSSVCFSSRSQACYS